MPRYEYACIECDFNIEISKTFDQATSEEFCEKCGYKMTKVYGTFGINLKGPGFYSTDNKK